VINFLINLVTLKNQLNLQKDTVKKFCEDTVHNISEYIKNLNDYRDRSQTIDSEFIDLVDVEIIVYGRNREHLIHIKNKDTRKSIRDFFTDVTIQVSRIRNNLSFFQNEMDRRNQFPINSAQYSLHQRNATEFLNKAHACCDKLVTLGNQKESLIRNLNENFE